MARSRRYTSGAAALRAEDMPMEKRNTGRTVSRERYRSAETRTRTASRTGVREREETRTKRARARSARAKARRRAAVLDRSYVVFLCVMVVATVFMCVQYIRLKEIITAQNRENDSLRAQLVTITSENDAYYESVVNSIDWTSVQQRAVHELGMKYAEEDDVMWYNTGNGSYVLQYQEIAPAS